MTEVECDDDIDRIVHEDWGCIAPSTNLDDAIAGLESGFQLREHGFERA